MWFLFLFEGLAPKVCNCADPANCTDNTQLVDLFLFLPSDQGFKHGVIPFIPGILESLLQRGQSLAN